MNPERYISSQELKQNVGGKANRYDFENNLPHSNSPLVNPQVSEILSTPPSWLIRWGISIFLLVLILFLVISIWVKYPELIKGNMKIVANELPKLVIARSDGNLVTLFIKDGQVVKKGQLLAQLETISNPNEVAQLSTLIDSLVQITLDGNLSKAYATHIPAFFQLGELQKSYQTFQSEFIRTKSFVGDGTALKKKAILQNDLNQIEELNTHLQHQLHDQESDFSIVKADLEMNEKLLQDKVVSRVEYRQALSKYLNKKQNVESSKSQLRNNELAQNQKKQELLELDKATTEQQNSLLQALRALKSDIDSWKQRFQPTAPIDGKIVFTQTLQENQTLKVGEQLFYILPKGIGYNGEMQLGQYNLGKVKLGQEVIVKLNGYPFEQHGAIKGKLVSLADIPQDSTYRAQISFPQGLITSNHDTIPFRNGMMATAEIITEDKSLFEQFFLEFVWYDGYC